MPEIPRSQKAPRSRGAPKAHYQASGPGLGNCRPAQRHMTWILVMDYVRSRQRGLPMPSSALPGFQRLWLIMGGCFGGGTGGAEAGLLSLFLPGRSFHHEAPISVLAPVRWTISETAPRHRRLRRRRHPSPPEPTLHGPTAHRAVAVLRPVDLALVLQHAHQGAPGQVDIVDARGQFALLVVEVRLDLRLDGGRGKGAARRRHGDKPSFSFFLWLPLSLSFSLFVLLLPPAVPELRNSNSNYLLPSRRRVRVAGELRRAKRENQTNADLIERLRHLVRKLRD
jgi:hypothetical protein